MPPRIRLILLLAIALRALAACSSDVEMIQGAAPANAAAPAASAVTFPALAKPAAAARKPETNAEVCDADEVATATYVFDGDTIAVRFADGHEDTVRYIGIDTPEVGEDCADAATTYQRGLVKGQSVHLLRDVRDRDIYGRLLRYACTADRVFVNAEMVAAGHAAAAKYEPDTRFAATFERLEDDAAVAGRGCLHAVPQADTTADGSLCCKICRNGKPCGDTCIPHERACASTSGCACSG